VFRKSKYSATKKSGINCVRSIEKKVMFLSKYSLDRNNTIASLFRTQYTPDFLIAEYCGLRNTIFWVTEDLASGVIFWKHVKTVEKIFLKYERCMSISCTISAIFLHLPANFFKRSKLTSKCLLWRLVSLIDNRLQYVEKNFCILLIKLLFCNRNTRGVKS
jgi:hypothetical protein